MPSFAVAFIDGLEGLLDPEPWFVILVFVGTLGLVVRFRLVVRIWFYIHTTAF